MLCCRVSDYAGIKYVKGKLFKGSQKFLDSRQFVSIIYYSLYVIRMKLPAVPLGCSRLLHVNSINLITWHISILIEAPFNVPNKSCTVSWDQARNNDSFNLLDEVNEI